MHPNVDSPMMASSPQPQRVPLPLHPETDRGAQHVLTLPVPRNAFIGRDAEITALQALLERPDIPLVTIIGPGGIGKTRLALHLARIMDTTLKDGIAYVPLAAVRDPMLVESVIAEHLGISASMTHTLRENVREFFRNRQFLLVLDNVEHLLAAAPLLAELLLHAPDLTILATSRIRLGITGEQLYPIDWRSCPVRSLR
jgi:predicted ATPase